MPSKAETQNGRKIIENKSKKIAEIRRAITVSYPKCRPRC